MLAPPPPRVTHVVTDNECRMYAYIYVCTDMYVSMYVCTDMYVCGSGCMEKTVEWSGGQNKRAPTYVTYYVTVKCFMVTQFVTLCSGTKGGLLY